MLRTISKIFIVALGLIFTPVMSAAETVYFIDGTVVEGQIIERETYYFKMMVDGVVTQHYLDSVERIVENGQAQEEAADNIDVTQFDNVPPDKVKKILTFLNVNGAKENMEKSINRIISMQPEERHEA